jgi:hypothetical protein
MARRARRLKLGSIGDVGFSGGACFQVDGFRGQIRCSIEFCHLGDGRWLPWLKAMCGRPEWSSSMTRGGVHVDVYVTRARLFLGSSALSCVIGEEGEGTRVVLENFAA